MAWKQTSKALIGAVLFGITSGAASAQSSDADVVAGDKARIVADLVRRGLVLVDPDSGQLILDGTVLEILREYGLIKDVFKPELRASNCHKCQECYTPQR